MQLRGVQTQIRIANDNLKVERDILTLAQERQQRGLQNGLDVENAAAQVEAVRAQIPQLQQQESEYINALSFLLDQPPGALRADAWRAASVRDRSAAHSARHSLRTGPAAPGYPRGGGSVARGDREYRRRRRRLLSERAIERHRRLRLARRQAISTSRARCSTISARASRCRFSQGGRLRSTLELRDAQQQEAAITYRKTVLQAWHDVVNALVAHRLETESPRAGCGRRPNMPAPRSISPARATMTASRNSSPCSTRSARCCRPTSNMPPARPTSRSIWCSCSRRWAAAGKPNFPTCRQSRSQCHSGKCLAGQCRAGQCARRAGAGSALMGCAGPI